MQEDRLLRSITVTHVEAALDRRMSATEAAALHAAIDVMLQRSAMALVDQQKIQLRVAAETELKFLSFLSHDMRNNLSRVSLWLQLLDRELPTTDEFKETQSTLKSALKAIHDTNKGMSDMLDHERLRKSNDPLSCGPVDLYESARAAVEQVSAEAEIKGIQLEVNIPHGTVVASNRELISVVLLNLLGNAIKYSERGTIRIGADSKTNEQFAVLSVSDEGLGISQPMTREIFNTFRRGEIHGQAGVGLGLAIASHAAKLLTSELTVESTVGVGSVFRLFLPISDPGTASGIGAASRGVLFESERVGQLGELKATNNSKDSNSCTIK